MSSAIVVGHALTRAYVQSQASKSHQHIYAPSPTLHLSRLEPAVSEESLLDLLRPYGEVRSFQRFSTDPKMALVEMGSTEEAATVITVRATLL